MVDWALLIVGAMAFVAYANGANDNFKGVATLLGGGATDGNMPPVDRISAELSFTLGLRINRVYNGLSREAQSS